MSRAPKELDATRNATSPSLSSSSSTKVVSTRIVTNRYNSALSLSCRILVAGILLSIFSYTSSITILDNCNEQSHEMGSPERTAQYVDDKHSQSVFIVLFHMTFLILKLCSIVEYSGTTTITECIKISLFWLMDAGIAYVWRVVLYLYVVRPLGLASETQNCGTSKSISGHTHFYCFHLLQLIYLVWMIKIPPLSNQPPSQPKSMGDSGDPKFLAHVLRWVLQLYALVVVVWTLTTLEQTYGKCVYIHF